MYSEYTGTNAEGRFVEDHMITDSTTIPEISVRVLTGDCVGMRDTVVSLPFSRTPGLAHDTVGVIIALEGTGLVQLAIGKSCAWGARRIPFREFELHLEIDSLTDSIRGSWKTFFTSTTVLAPGTFAGTRQGDSLFLMLRNSKCSAGYPFRAHILGNDAIGPGRLESPQDDTTCPPHFGFDVQLVMRDIQTYRPE